MGIKARELKPKSGYAYEYKGARWARSSDERWDTIMFTPKGTERLVGYRSVDDSPVLVFQAGPRRFVAQTMVSLGAGALANKILEGRKGPRAKIRKDRYIVESRPRGPGPWAPAITGTLNQTGTSDKTASSFDDIAEARAALRIVRAEMGKRWESRIRDRRRG